MIEHSPFASELQEGIKAAIAEPAPVRGRRMAEVMQAIWRVAKEVADGRLTWSDVRNCTSALSGALVDARNALDDWDCKTGDYAQDGEDGAVLALERRSQLAFARQVFADTPADARLSLYEDAEFDAELHQLAVDFHLTPDDWVPRTHTWWWWPDQGRGE